MMSPWLFNVYMANMDGVVRRCARVHGRRLALPRAKDVRFPKWYQI